MSREGVRWTEVAGLAAMAAAVVIFWSTPVLAPLRILVVFFHEASHGLMAIATGGSIEKIALDSQEGGLCQTLGGSRFLTLSAGYLGSLVWGGLILVIAARTRGDRILGGILGCILIAVSLLFVRPFGEFGFIFSFAFGIVMVGIAAFLPQGVNDFLLKLIGLVSCLYAILDIWSDIFLRPADPSDARALAELTGLPTLFWGVLWMALAGVGTLFFLLIAGKPSQGAPKKS